MKKSILLFLSISLLSLSIRAQENQSVKTDSIIFENLVHDYGTIVQGSDGNYEFIFTNKGKLPLILTNVRASCGCTVAKWPREPIETGQEGTISVKYNTNIAGTFNKSITVNSNAVNSPVVLRIKGSVTPKQ